MISGEYDVAEYSDSDQDNDVALDVITCTQSDRKYQDNLILKTARLDNRMM